MSHDDGLNVVERFGAGTPNIRKQRLPTPVDEQAAQLWHFLEEFGSDRNAARDGIALLVLACFKLGFEQRRLDFGKLVGRQEVADLDETVAIELLAPVDPDFGSETLSS